MINELESPRSVDLLKLSATCFLVDFVACICHTLWKLIGGRYFLVLLSPKTFPLTYEKLEVNNS